MERGNKTGILTSVANVAATREIGGCGGEVWRQREARLRNKQKFDKKHRLRPRKIRDGDWVIVYDNSLDHQHSTVRKFAKRWFGPYEVCQGCDNGTYWLSELDGTVLRTPIAGKRVKIF